MDVEGEVQMAKFAKGVGLLLVVLIAIAAYNVMRHIVYWGPTEQVTIESDGATLACTFIKPGHDGVYPAVLQLMGSGRETRAEPSYRVNANNLVRHGFAAMLCDKRGSGESSGDFTSATFVELTQDAVASVHYLAQRQDVQPGSIGIFTNSESGWYAPQVALEAGHVAFIINRVGSPLSWTDTVTWEVRNEFINAGIAENELSQVLKTTLNRWRFYIDVHKGVIPPEGIERNQINAELKQLRNSIPFTAEVVPERVMDYDAKAYRRFAVNAEYAPEQYLRQLDIPLLYVFGGEDVNIPTQAGIEFLKALEDDYPAQLDVLVYPALGHSLVTWSGALSAGYPPEYLDYVGKWAQRAITD